MNKLEKLILYGMLIAIFPIGANAENGSRVCTDIGELMHGDQEKCKKGDIIMVNPMMAAFLCDMDLPSIAGEKTVVCHYLGKKRPVRVPGK